MGPEIKIVENEKIDWQQWDEFVASHQHGTMFHLSSWKKVIESSFRYRAHYAAAVLDDKIVGIFPAFAVYTPFIGRTLISTPFAVYGGPLWVDVRCREIFHQWARDTVQKTRSRFFEIRTGYDTERLGFDPIQGYLMYPKKPVSGPALMDSMNAKVRGRLRQALKNPFALEKVENVDDFYELFSENMHRLGTPHPTRKYFENLKKYLNGPTEIYEVRLNRDLAACNISFCWGGVFHSFYSASSERFIEARPNHFLYANLLGLADNRGFRWFEFGRSLQGSGTQEFKLQWKPEETPMHYEVCLSPGSHFVHRSHSSRALRITSEIWRRLPFWLVRPLGPLMAQLMPA